MPAALTENLKIGVAGLGSMGRQHVRVLSEMDGVDVVVVADADPAARQRVEEHAPVATVSDWGDLLEFPIDAVVNALPTPAHHEVTLALLEAGKHVLVEKPIATTPEQAEELVASADHHGRLLVVGHVERFNPAITRLQELLAAGGLGETVAISTRRVGIARPVAPATDVVIDLAIHDIDVCGFLLPETQGRLAFASARALWGNQVEDHADLVVRFGQTVAAIQANWITPVKIRRLTVTGTEGIADVDYLEQSLRVYRGAPEVFSGPIWDFFAVARESEPEDVPVERAEPLRAELESFVAQVREGDISLVQARHASRALALAVEARDMIRGTR
jgi:UDP-N-acetylglucosamine 3-dehydrogenase